MPFLFAFTPRAGRWNHRSLKPAAPPLSAADLRRISAAARENPTGEGYVAARRSVRQETTGRTGEELLILADLDTGRLDEQEIRRVQQALESRMSDLDRLVTQEIDWDCEGKADPVIRAEMRQWLSGELADLPGPKPEGRVRSVRDKLKKKEKKILQLLLALSLLTGGGVSYIACDPCQKWVNSLPDKFSLWGGSEASAPVSPETCQMLKGTDQCTEEDLQAACKVVDVNDCEPKYIADKIGELNKDDSFQEEFAEIVERYKELNSVSRDTLYGSDAAEELKKLNDAADEAFKKAIGFKDDSASFDRYVQAWNYRAELRGIYGLIPEECKENYVEGASGTELKKDALRYREIVDFLKTVQEHEKKEETDKLCFLSGHDLFDKVGIATVEVGRNALEKHKKFVSNIAKDGTSDRKKVAKALLAISKLRSQVVP